MSSTSSIFNKRHFHLVFQDDVKTHRRRISNISFASFFQMLSVCSFLIWMCLDKSIEMQCWVIRNLAAVVSQRSGDIYRLNVHLIELQRLQAGQTAVTATLCWN